MTDTDVRDKRAKIYEIIEIALVSSNKLFFAEPEVGTFDFDKRYLVVANPIIAEWEVGQYYPPDVHAFDTWREVQEFIATPIIDDVSGTMWFPNVVLDLDDCHAIILGEPVITWPNMETYEGED